MHALSDSRIPKNIRPRLVESESGCWLWIGPTTPGGYAAVSHAGSSWALHRLMYVRFVGEIEGGMHIHHKCGLRNCCNPAHLECLSPGDHNKKGEHVRRERINRYGLDHTSVEQLHPDLQKIAKDTGLPIEIVRSIRIDPNGCWLWCRKLSPQGYGRIKIGGGNKHAHREVYKITRGEIPEGMVIHHTCSVRHCVNPEHLECITHPKNVQLGRVPLIQLSKTHCPEGHPYDDANTYRNNSASGATRRCKICTQLTNRKQYEKLKTIKATMPSGAGCGDAVMEVCRTLGPEFGINEVVERLNGRYIKLQVTRSFDKLKMVGKLRTVRPKYSQTPAVFALS